MAQTLTPETETHLRTAAQERSFGPADLRKEFPVQGSPEWEQRLWSLGRHSHGAPLSLEATSREVIYEDTEL